MVEMFGAAILMLGVLWAVVTVEGLLKVLERTPPERSGAANASRPLSGARANLNTSAQT